MSTERRAAVKARHASDSVANGSPPQGLLDLLVELIDPGRERREDRLVHRGEVVEDRAPGDARPLGEALDAESVDPVLRRELRGGLDDRLAIAPLGGLALVRRRSAA